MPLKDWIPNFKDALVNFYDERIKDTLESKTTEFKTLVQENMARGVNTQKAVVAILLAVFLLLALAFFWKDKETGIQWKYLALGGLISYTVSYVIDLKPQEFAEKLFNKQE